VDPDIELGREVAGYRLEEVIGRGGMGVVYRAEHLRLGRKVALKVVAPQIAREPKFRERFLRESRTAGSLDHPNVVPMYDAGEADGLLYIAMRFVDGVDLATLISRDGRLEPARTARIVSQVANALDAAHEAGLVHRDVKPSNVLLPERGAGRGEHAYLGDFGLTKRVLSESGVTGSSAFLGTIAYVAPEQIEGRAVDAKADQYSLACLVFECLTGHRPFERETDIATLYAHIRDPFPSVGDAVEDPVMRAALDEVLSRGAAKKPEERYDSCGELAEDVVRVTGATTGVAAPPAATVRRSSGGLSTREGVAIGLGTALVVVVLLFVGGFVLLQNLGPPAAPVTGNGVARIDPATNQATLAAGLSAPPTGMAADGTAAWVVHFSVDGMSRIDAATNDVNFLETRLGPGAIAAAEGCPAEGDADAPGCGRVWVAIVTDEILQWFDADDYTRNWPSLQLDFRPGAMTIGDGGVWIIDLQTESVLPVPADTPNVLANPVSVGREPVSVAAGGGAVWVSNSLDRGLSRIAIGSASAEAPIDLGFAPGALALDVASDALWIVDAAGDAVVRFHSRSRDVEARVPVGPEPRAVAIGAGGVWVASGDGTVTRIDTETNEVLATITVGGEPVAVAVVGDVVWVAVAEP
jgi:serine/threonine-protein kinase